MANILLTGGTGFIGVHLVKKLQSLGHNLKLLIRDTSDITPFQDLKNVEYVNGDVRDIDSLYDAINGVQFIYHLAGQVKVWAKDKKAFYDINVQGTENIAEVALKNNLVLFYMSSFGALGTNPKNSTEPTDESFPHVDFFINEYERTKFLGREKLNEYIEKGLKTVIFYPGFVYGPGDFNIYGEMVFDIVAGQFLGLPGNGESLFCMSYFDDVINGMISVIDREDLIGQGFVLGGENIKIIEFLNLVAELAEVKKPRKLPMWAGLLYGRFCRFKANISKKRIPYLTPDMIIGMKYNWAFTSKSAIEKLGYQITPIREGLMNTVEWYKDFIKINGKNKKKIGIRMC
ncbi:MAG: NAD-dependent epimerase/dehydratase family protein [Candidatus Lokiarchaeota archaeon]|nr:NAD-dependent epimerase/dehydratase family protein [Candidatus Lokiarchaeota archaeon]